ncbi:MAG TPA: sodium:calcium antiporter [bacterium]|nr:sodium:calcium antiporter [bacterium]
MPLAIADILMLIAAIPLAAVGGEAFLKGILGISAWLRLPKMLVAVTLAAFATSSPELTVSSLAALAGTPEIGLGDALGSNVVNVGLILGLALLFGALPVHFPEIKRDFILALSIPVLTLLLALDGNLSRTDGLVLLGVFAIWIALAIRQALIIRHTTLSDPSVTAHPLKAGLLMLLGLVFLVVSGRLFVSGASGIAIALGIPDYVIGATVVAMGTSLPELVTTLIARLRGHDEVGIGTLLGSNLFNGMAIVGVAASIHPIHTPLNEIGVAIGFGVLTVLLLLPYKKHLSPQRGLALLAAYAAFITVTLAI